MAEEKASPSLTETGASVYSAPPPEKKYSPTARKKRRRNLIIILAAVVLIFAGLLLWRYFGSYESTDDAQADVHLYPVSARVSGHVIRVNVGDNEWVQKGAVLVEIDLKDYEVAVAQAQANLANAEATAHLAEYHGANHLRDHPRANCGPPPPISKTRRPRNHRRPEAN